LGIIVLEQVVLHLRRRTLTGKWLPGPTFATPFLGGLISMICNPELWWEQQRLYAPKDGLSANYMLGKMMVFSTNNDVNRAVLVGGGRRVALPTNDLHPPTLGPQPKLLHCASTLRPSRDKGPALAGAPSRHCPDA
jgi:hypothetical protein